MVSRESGNVCAHMFCMLSAPNGDIKSLVPGVAVILTVCPGATDVSLAENVGKSAASDGVAGISAITSAAITPREVFFIFSASWLFLTASLKLTPATHGYNG